MHLALAKAKAAAAAAAAAVVVVVVVVVAMRVQVEIKVYLAHHIDSLHRGQISMSFKAFEKEIEAREARLDASFEVWIDAQNKPRAYDALSDFRRKHPLVAVHNISNGYGVRDGADIRIVLGVCGSNLLVHHIITEDRFAESLSVVLQKQGHSAKSVHWHKNAASFLQWAHNGGTRS
jgi:hypothetical protein